MADTALTLVRDLTVGRTSQPKTFTVYVSTLRNHPGGL